MFKRILLSIFIFSIALSGQTTELEEDLKKKQEIPEGLKYGGVVSANFAQTALSNWSSGGNNSIAINGLLNLFLTYRKNNTVWNNTANFGYGLLKQGKESDYVKTDDRVEINSKYGYKAKKDWYYSGMINFVTQMAKGYKYENDSVKISAPFAPAYLTGAIGMDYQKKDYAIFLSPLTTKITFVYDDDLSRQGAFGVEKDSNLRMELGGYVKTNFRKELLENVTLDTDLSLFSNFLENPENIDIDWKILLAMKVNQYISANITTHLIYDDDITTINEEGKEEGPKLQIKEIFGIGISYSFK